MRRAIAKCGERLSHRQSWLAAVPLLLSAGLASADTTSWRIASINGVAAQGETELQFSADGGINGSAGCNRFSGSARIIEGALIIEAPLATTRMACPDTASSTQEDTVLRLLSDRVTIDFDPVAELMILTREADRITLAPIVAGRDRSEGNPPGVFTAGYVNVFGLEGPLNIRQEATTTSAIVTRVLAGTLLRNLGCESREDRDWCQISFIDASGLTGWAAAEYLQPAPALVRAKDGVFDRIGGLSCSIPQDGSAQDCDFGLARDGGHSAALMIYRPDGGTSLLGFIDGRFSMAFEDGAPIAGFESTSEGDTLTVTGEGARYEVPTALLEHTLE
ncbi:META domain-containing protein [Roseivivax lentus]|uniref:META domain-containing protein n=1 Tax=Roseivivax lentus TaxID=633194 RepID=UPI00135650B9|nr:META domain-containing protein [Roseivivax lentus]